jgi:hypothetical protein
MCACELRRDHTALDCDVASPGSVKVCVRTLVGLKVLLESLSARVEAERLMKSKVRVPLFYWNRTLHFLVLAHAHPSFSLALVP